MTKRLALFILVLGLVQFGCQSVTPALIPATIPSGLPAATDDGISLRVPAGIPKNISEPFEPIVFIKEPKQFTKIFVMSDAHGMFDELVKLLQWGQVIDAKGQWAIGKSLFLVLGDSIDKGSDSLKVLALWIDLQAQAQRAGWRLIHTLGNHEAGFMGNPLNSKAKEFREELAKNNVSISDFLNPNKVFGWFLRRMPVAVRVGNWFFAHSGFMPYPSFQEFEAQTNQVFKDVNYLHPLFSDSASILEAKDWWMAGSRTRQSQLSKMTRAGIFGLVFGHQPGGLGVKKKLAQSLDGRLIKVDSGMSPDAGEHKGRILVLLEPSQLAGQTPLRAGVIHSQETGLERLSPEDDKGGSGGD